MNLQRQTLAMKDMELFEELTDTDLEAVVGGTVTQLPGQLLNAFAGATGQEGQTAGSAIDGVQGTLNTTIDGTQKTLGGAGIALYQIETGLT